MCHVITPHTCERVPCTVGPCRIHIEKKKHATSTRDKTIGLDLFSRPSPRPSASASQSAVWFLGTETQRAVGVGVGALDHQSIARVHIIQCVVWKTHRRTVLLTVAVVGRRRLGPEKPLPSCLYRQAPSFTNENERKEQPTGLSHAPVPCAWRRPTGAPRSRLPQPYRHLPRSLSALALSSRPADSSSKQRPAAYTSSRLTPPPRSQPLAYWLPKRHPNHRAAPRRAATSPPAIALSVSPKLESALCPRRVAEGPTVIAQSDASVSLVSAYRAA